MKFFFYLLFAAVTTIHLYASFNKNKTLRAKSKPFILLSLLGIYIFSATTIRFTVVAALVFSWIGDLLLIPDGVKWFTAGGISFIIGHTFFILGYYPDVDFAALPVWLVASLAAVFIIAVTVIFSKVKEFLPKIIICPMYFYLIINGTMNCFAILRMLSNVNISTVTTCIGAFLFFISDSSLFFVRFNKNGRLKTHFLVMLTYSVGEFLIVLGLV